MPLVATITPIYLQELIKSHFSVILLTMSTAPSPGNGIFAHGPQMRQPSLAFLYRLECDIAKEEINIGAPHNAGTIRSIANILGGTIKGPGIEASILPLGGADWASVVKGTHV